jgi:hypothetical protein
MIYNNPNSNIGQAIQVSSANIDRTGVMLGQRVNYTINSGVGIVSTANSNRDGTGTLTQIYSSGVIGAYIRTITIKAQGNTTQGMIRLFVWNTVTSFLIVEIEVPIVTQTSIASSFTATINLQFYLQSGFKLYASTQNGDTFILTVEGLSMSYP